VHAGEEATHDLDGQHQDVDRTLRGRVNQNDRGQGQAEKVRPWCGQPSDRGRLKKRTGRRKSWAKRHKLARLGHAATTRGTCGTTYVRLCPVITVQNKYYTADQNKTKKTGHTVT